MPSFSRRAAMLIAPLLALSLVAAACGDDDDDTSETSAGNGEELTGTIIVSGSSTVQPISSLVGEAFSADNPEVSVTVDGPGTGDGFELFCAGETDISDASRAIDDEEAAACEDAGIEFVELQIGIDGLAVMTNEANGDVECLNFNDLYALTGPESDGFDNWTDAQDLATELGSDTELPDADLTIYGPGEESGTYDSYVELALEDIAEERGEEPATRADYNSSANDNEIIAGIQSEDTTLGWVGFAFADQAEGVTLLEVDNGDSGCTAPTAETIASGDYPLSRPLFIYVNTAKADESPALQAFVDYYVGDGITAVEEADYVALEDDALEETRSAWADR